MLDFRFPIGGIVRVLLRLAFWILVAPWVALALLRAIGRRFDDLMRAVLAMRHALAAELRCPAGHASNLHGVFECRSCGALFAGWAFQGCPVCGQSCGYLPCEHCGLGVRNPFA